MNPNKTRVLIYCYDFPPLSTVGANRPYAWSKFLNEFGIFPTVLTRKWKAGIKSPEEYFKNDAPGVTRVETEEFTWIKAPYKKRFKDHLPSIPIIGFILRKAVTMLELIFRWNISICDEKRFLEKELNSLISKESFDLIIVTGEPFILFKHVKKAAVKHNIPFILDYRDRWWYHEDLGIRLNRLKTLIRKLEVRQEESIMKYASGYIFVFERLREIYNSKYPSLPSFTIENGIDLDILNNARRIDSPFKKNIFTILYTGVLYPSHNASLFTNAFLSFVSKLPEQEKNNIRCEFIGILYQMNQSSKHIKEAAKNHPKIIKILPRVNHVEALAHQLNAQILLKFSIDTQIKMGLGAKLSEYAATKNPILTVISVPDKETPFFPGRNIQTICSEQEEIEQYISFQYAQWKQGKSLKTDITDDEIYHMSRRHQTEQLASVIKSTLA